MPPAKQRNSKTSAKKPAKKAVNNRTNRTHSDPPTKTAQKPPKTARRAPSPTGRVGAPVKLNASVQRQICEGIRKGMTNTAAAAGAGVTKGTFYDWIKKGHKKGGRKLYKDFVEAIEHAYEEFEAAAIEVISEHAFEGWDATKTTVKTIKDKKTGKTLDLLEVVKKTEKMIPDIASLKWLLERRRQGFTPMQRIEHTQEDDRPLEIVFIPPKSAKDKDGTVATPGDSPTDE